MTTAEIPEGVELLTIDQVAAIMQLSSRTIWRMVSSEQFPQPIALGDGVRPRKRWSRRELLAWIDRKMKARRGEG